MIISDKNRIKMLQKEVKNLLETISFTRFCLRFYTTDEEYEKCCKLIDKNLKRGVKHD